MGAQVPDQAASGRDRLWLVGTFTADPLRAPLELWWDVLGLAMDVRIAPYAQLFPQLLDPASGLRLNRRGANVLLVRWDDLAGHPPDIPERGAVAAWREKLRGTAGELAEALAAAPLAVPTLLVLAPSRFPRDGGAGREIADVEAGLNGRVADVAGLTVVDAPEVARRYPVADWSDPESDRFGHVPYTPEYFAALSAVVARWHLGVASPPRKVLALDCDNTLWGGVVAEDGASGVRVDGPHAAVQRFAAAQAAAGRLVALCSKNEPADVFEVFARRPEMELSRAQVAAHRIGWEPKSAALRELAREMDLALDSFVFIDDSPLECAEVRARCPEVLTLQLPADPARVPEFLAHIWPLDTGRVTEEDRRRLKMYADNAVRSQVRRGAPSLRAFLDGLELEVEIRPAAPGDVGRASQLTHRTNQFNAAQARLSEVDVAARMADASSPVSVVSARDRFGDYGTVGVLAARAAGGELVAEVFLLSCRALGRGVEHRMLAHLGREAEARGLAAVAVPFRPTERNRPARRFLERTFGAPAAPEGETVFRLPASSAAAVRLDPEQDGAGHGEDAGSDVERRSAPAALAVSETFQRIADELTSASAVLQALGRRTRVRPAMAAPFVAPRRGVERAIADVWQEVLRVEGIGARDSFRDLGGQSLELVQVHRLLLERLRVDLDITALFQRPTVADLAALVESESPLAAGRDAAGRAERMRAAYVRQAAMRRGARRG